MCIPNEVDGHGSMQIISPLSSSSNIDHNIALSQGSFEDFNLSKQEKQLAYTIKAAGIELGVEFALMHIK
jgi:hypothetical protein